MFRWLTKQLGSKSDPTDLIVQEAWRSGSNRGAIARALQSSGVHLDDQRDNPQFCIRASSAIVRLVANRAGVSIPELSDRDRFPFAILAFAVSDLISQMIGTPGDKEKIMFEAVSSVAAMDLFGAEYAGEIGKVADAYNHLTGEGGPVRALGSSVRAWIADPSSNRLDKIAAGYRATRGN
jgi:hypothetical protein